MTESTKKRKRKDVEKDSDGVPPSALAAMRNRPGSQVATPSIQPEEQRGPPDKDVDIMDDSGEDQPEVSTGSRSKITEKTKDAMRFKLSQGDEIYIVGEFSLAVLQGSVSILGAKLSSVSKESYVVRTLACGPPTIIRCISEEEAEVEAKSIQRALTFIQSWEKKDLVLGNETAWGGYSFFPLSSVHEQNSIMGGISQFSSSSLTALNDEIAAARIPRVVLISNNDRSGYYIARYLLNCAVTSHGATNFINLDPARPNLFTPTTVFLTRHETSFLEAACFQSPLINSASSKVHGFGYLSIDADLSQYRQLALDLIGEATSSISGGSNRSPAVVCLPHPQSALAKETILSLVAELDPTFIVYEENGTGSGEETLSAMLRGYTSTLRPIRFLSSAKSPLSSRDLRDLQTSSFFHFKGDNSPTTTPPSSFLSTPTFRLPRYEVATISTYILLQGSSLPNIVLPTALTKTIVSIILYPKTLLPKQADPAIGHILPSSTKLDPRFSIWVGMAILCDLSSSPPSFLASSSSLASPQDARNWSVIVDPGCATRIENAKIGDSDLAPVFVRGRAEPWWEWAQS